MYNGDFQVSSSSFMFSKILLRRAYKTKFLLPGSNLLYITTYNANVVRFYIHVNIIRKRLSYTPIATKFNFELATYKTCLRSSEKKKKKKRKGKGVGVVQT